MISHGEKSYASWASAMTEQIGVTVSKQGLFKRMNYSWVKLLKILVERVLQIQIAETSHKLKCRLFTNIYIQDSTSISLPDFMRHLFPGNYSRGKQKAVAKINVIINVMSGLCTRFSISSFTTNEQRLSDTILSIAKAGDLVIRDLGYYVLDVFKRMSEEGIFFISRQRFGVFLIDPKTLKELSIVKLLKNKSHLDINVLCGKKQNLPVRLIAFRLDRKKVAQKVRKARQDRDKRLNHSKEYYISLGYVICITNIEKSKCSALEITELYRLRWQIEILFKSWKSGIKIEALIPSDQYKTDRIESVIYMMMLYIAWFEYKVYNPIRLETFKQNIKNISRIKLSSFILKNINHFLIHGILKKDIENITYFCTNETRRRVNATKHMLDLLTGFG